MRRMRLGSGREVKILVGSLLGVGAVGAGVYAWKKPEVLQALQAKFQRSADQDAAELEESEALAEADLEESQAEGDSEERETTHASGSGESDGLDEHESAAARNSHLVHGGKKGADSHSEVFDAVSSVAQKKTAQLGMQLGKSTPRLRSGVDAQGRCASVEYPGYNPEIDGWDEASWKAIHVSFEEAKKDLKDWIQRDVRLSERSREVMQTQLAAMKLERPKKDEPDLYWRGIPVWTLSGDAKDKDQPRVRVGLGFGELLRRKPARARFELVRAMAQSWSPCELSRLNAPLIFEKELSCLGMQTQENCTAASYSESGWALSTWIAKEVAPPGCQIPALEMPGVGQCLSGVAQNASRAVASSAPAVAAKLAVEASHEPAHKSGHEPAHAKSKQEAHHE